MTKKPIDPNYDTLEEKAMDLSDPCHNVTSMPVPQHITAPTLTQVIIERIRAGATLEETKQYYSFIRQIEADEALKAFNRDFVLLELPEIPRLGKIDIGRGKPQMYAKWEDITKRIEPELHKHNFRLSFDVIENETHVNIKATLHHSAGHSLSTSKQLPLDKSGSKNIVQAFGSTQSYGMRYATIALLGLASRGEDDDAQSTSSNLLTSEELEVIKAALDDADANDSDMTRFCKTMKVESLTQLRREQVADAMARIASFKELKRKQKATENAAKNA